jgi:hypothetical protein
MARDGRTDAFASFIGLMPFAYGPVHNWPARTRQFAVLVDDVTQALRERRWVRIVKEFGFDVTRWSNFVLLQEPSPVVAAPLLRPSWATAPAPGAGPLVPAALYSTLTVTATGVISDIGSLSRLREGRSAHFLVGLSGRIINIVPLGSACVIKDITFGKGTSDGGTSTTVIRDIISEESTVVIAHEGKMLGGLTPAQALATVELQAWLCQKFGIEPLAGVTLVGDAAFQLVTERLTTVQEGITKRLVESRTPVVPLRAALTGWFSGGFTGTIERELRDGRLREVRAVRDVCCPARTVPAGTNGIVGAYVQAWWFHSRVVPMRPDELEVVDALQERLQRS